MSGCMVDYDEDCKGTKPDGCMCLTCCTDYTEGTMDLSKELAQVIEDNWDLFKSLK